MFRTRVVDDGKRNIGLMPNRQVTTEETRYICYAIRYYITVLVNIVSMETNVFGGHVFALRAIIQDHI